MSTRWLLPPLWFDLCWEIGKFDEYPFPIKVRSHGETLEERAVLKQRAMPEMQAAGLLVGDRLTQAFGAVLAQIAKPGLWIEGLWMPDDVNPSPVRLMSIVFDQAAILLVQGPGESKSYGGDIRISVHNRTSIAAAAIQGMPPAPPGKRPRMSALLSDLGSKDDNSGGMLEPASGPERRAANALVELVEAEHFRSGQFTANLLDPMGRSHRSSVLKWFDAAEPDGRYALTQQQRSGLGPELVVAPVGPAEIGKALDNRVNEVRAAARDH